MYMSYEGPSRHVAWRSQHISTLAAIFITTPSKLQQDSRFKTPELSLPITHHPSPITHHPSPITHHPSPITHYPGPRYANHAMEYQDSRYQAILDKIPKAHEGSRVTVGLLHLTSPLHYGKHNFSEVAANFTIANKLLSAGRQVTASS
ncbi:hypothetical protein FPQ18DRAFT_302783 [Pyronema domesticum]|nr:hypothetical protein FPQ18DRAFT_302783 [Pyronema domesticum]